MLDEVLDRIWGSLMVADGDHRSPFSFMQAATIGLDGSPKLRTVVLRRVERNSARIWFSTDLRSPKIAELRKDPRISMAGYDLAERVQIRMEGNAEIDADSTMRLMVWRDTARTTRQGFRSLLPPGTPLDAPSCTQAIEPTNADDGFENFCLVVMQVTTIDWLDLSSSHQTRAMFHQRQASEWHGTWVSP